MNASRWIVVTVLCTAVAFGMVRYVFLVLDERAASRAAESANEATAADLPLPPGVMMTESFRAPVPGSVPTTAVRHTIELDEIRRGCFQQDCIPSVDTPAFTAANTLQDTLSSSSLGIYIASADRFYPFPMLETREIVNDVLPDGTPVAVTYCPLCGTGIVFKRELADGAVTEFGVSGMLWQSNLLMYDRAAEQSDRNLWSQVLGQAVVGNRAGETLQVVPSDIITYGDWVARNPSGQTLTTGSVAAPYGTDYFGTARFFEPNFDESTSPLAPMERVHGIIVDGIPKAYVTADLSDELTDIVGETRVFVSVVDDTVSFFESNAETGNAPTPISDVEGFWFSWVAAHPDTQLWSASVYE